MTPFMLDLLVILILGFCVWQGFRKGLVLMVAGVLVVILSAWFAGGIAGRYAEPFAEKIQPVFGWIADDAIAEASRGKGQINDITDRDTLAEIAQDALGKLGFSFLNKDGLVGAVFETVREKEMSFREAVSHTFLRGLSHMILCVFVFIVLMILFTILTHFIASVFKLPVLNLVDKVGGTALGLLYGILVLTVLGWALKHTGMLIPGELIERTVFLEMFYRSNILTGLLGSIGK